VRLLAKINISLSGRNDGKERGEIDIVGLLEDVQHLSSNSMMSIRGEERCHFSLSFAFLPPCNQSLTDL